MYQALLTRRYLFSKVMPLLASLAVMLCTAMVLTVWSVMGGFLSMLLSSGRTFIGDVAIAWPVVGIPYYSELVKEIEQDPLVEAATPTIEALGLLGLPTGESRTVQVFGIEPEGYQRVTGYHERVYWKRLDAPLKKDVDERDPRLTLPEGFENDAHRLVERDAGTGVELPGIMLGVEVARYNRRTPEGFIVPEPGLFMPDQQVTLTVLPLSQRGVAISTEDRRLPVVNEFRTGLYEADANWAIVPIDVLQKMLKLDAGQRIPRSQRNGTIEIGPDGRERLVPPKPMGVEPARATNILIKAKPGVAPEVLRDRVREIYRRFAETDDERFNAMPLSNRVLIFTWDRKPGLETFIAAVKKETAVVLVLFSFISLTAVFLVIAIFWAMVSEKTKDIGVLRAIGASKIGVAWLWIRYGLAIGIVGSVLGGMLAYAVVLNINAIHEWLGKTLGIVVWDPTVYYFTDIPARVEPLHAVIVLSGGILSCAVGAIIPALRAATMDPVRALRFE
ncbi:MAG: ABC transporter permease [Phycisphaerales bacterium]